MVFFLDILTFWFILDVKSLEIKNLIGEWTLGKNNRRKIYFHLFFEMFLLFITKGDVN